MSRLEVDLFDPEPDPDLLCAICQCVLCNPMESSTCRHVFCHKCIMTWLNGGSCTCPTCRSPMTTFHLRRALPALCNVIGRLLMKCVNHVAGCGARLPVEQLETHLRSDCQWVTERCECGAQLLRRDLEAHKDVCLYCAFPCSKCDLMITAKDRNTHNCTLALQQTISGSKYLLTELRRQLEQGTVLSSQLHGELASFDRLTRNYVASLTIALPVSSTPNPSAAASHSPDVLIQFSPSTSRMANQQVSLGEVGQPVENAQVGGFSPPVSPQYHSAGEASRHSPSASSLVYFSDDDFRGSMSPSTDITQHLSDIDEEYEPDATSFDGDYGNDYSNDGSLLDDDYRSHGSNEHYGVASTDSDNDSNDSRAVPVSRDNSDDDDELRMEREERQNDGGDAYDENAGQADRRTGGSSQEVQEQPTHARPRSDDDEHDVAAATSLAHEASVNNDTPSVARNSLRSDIFASDDEDDNHYNSSLSDDECSFNSHHSSASSSLPASPSLQDDNDNSHGNELFHSDASDNDDDGGDHDLPAEETQTSNNQQNSRPDSGQNGPPTSPALSATSSRASSVSDQDQRRCHSTSANSLSWWVSVSHDSRDSDDTWSPGPSALRQQGVKRRRSSRSATSTDDDASDDEGRQHHKLHRFQQS